MINELYHKPRRAQKRRAAANAPTLPTRPSTQILDGDKWFGTQQVGKHTHVKIIFILIVVSSCKSWTLLLFWSPWLPDSQPRPFSSFTFEALDFRILNRFTFTFLFWDPRSPGFSTVSTFIFLFWDPRSPGFSTVSTIFFYYFSFFSKPIFYFYRCASQTLS